MKTLIKAILLILLASVATQSRGNEVISHLQPHQEYDPQNMYFVSLLRLALDESVEKYGEYSLNPINLNMLQARQLKSLKDGTLTALWTAYTPQRERDTIVVKFPLLNGLLGQRVFVILKKNQHRFPRDMPVENLKKLIGLQGHDWPDADILQHNGFEVKTTHWYQHMYGLLKQEFVDYFPRGVLEAPQELQQQNSDSFIIEKNHLLSYPMYVYFFVNTDNPKLATRLKYGMEKAKQNGKFTTLLYQHPSHARALKNIKMEQRRVHQLTLPD